jgi:hypothetical protein
VCLLWGTVAAVVYHAQGLTLSHYDAKGHLVVARRVLDSLTPTWRQIGAVWLPLPHLLNLFPVQIDAFYRTGFSAVAISIVSLAMAAVAAGSMVLRGTGSRAAAALAIVLLAANPNLLYLQSTPMTEPLLLAFLMGAALSLQTWVETGERRWHRRAGWLLAAAWLTRYEAWPFTGAAIALAAVARARSGVAVRAAAAEAARLSVYPLVALLAFLVNSYLSTGHWFVTGGFYVPDPALQGDAVRVSASVWWGVAQLGSYPLAVGASLAIPIVAVVLWRRRSDSALLVSLAFVAIAMLPWYAFYEGHPFRIRYMVPLVAGAILGCSLAIGLLHGWARTAVAVAFGACVLYGAPPFNRRAPMVVEAQWDVPNSHGRSIVTRCLAARHPGEAILASMGSLAHYMQELSGAGLNIADFVHEGNWDLWASALREPSRYVGWVLIEERAEGGDMLAALTHRTPSFLAGFTRVCSGGGVALYRIDRGLPIRQLTNDE